MANSPTFGTSGLYLACEVTIPQPHFARCDGGADQRRAGAIHRAIRGRDRVLTILETGMTTPRRRLVDGGSLRLPRGIRDAPRGRLSGADEIERAAEAWGQFPRAATRGKIARRLGLVVTSLSSSRRCLVVPCLTVASFAAVPIPSPGIMGGCRRKSQFGARK